MNNFDWTTYAEARSRGVLPTDALIESREPDRPSLDSLLAAVLHHAKSSEYPPTPASVCVPIDAARSGIPPVSDCVAEVYRLAALPSLPGWEELPGWLQPMVEASGGWHAIRNTVGDGVTIALRVSHRDLVARERADRSGFALPPADDVTKHLGAGSVDGGE